MELTQEQYESIADCFPVSRGDVKYSNLTVLNAAIYSLKNGCTWRDLPKDFGNWHTIYTRVHRWSKKEILARVFLRLQQLRLIEIKVEVLAVDSTNIRVHPDGTGALKKTAHKPSAVLVADAPVKFHWLPRMIETP